MHNFGPCLVGDLAAQISHCHTAVLRHRARRCRCRDLRRSRSAASFIHWRARVPLSRFRKFVVLSGDITVISQPSPYGSRPGKEASLKRSFIDVGDFTLDGRNELGLLAFPQQRRKLLPLAYPLSALWQYKAVRLSCQTRGEIVQPYSHYRGTF